MQNKRTDSPMNRVGNFVDDHKAVVFAPLIGATVLAAAWIAKDHIGVDQIEDEKRVSATSGDTLIETIGEVCPANVTNYEATRYESHIETQDGVVVQDPGTMQIGHIMVINCMGNK